MPHADSSFVPSSIVSKADFWDHVYTQLVALLEGQRTWVTNLANTSSTIYNSLLAFPAHFGDGERAVNWCGFYVDSQFFPVPRIVMPDDVGSPSKLLLGPFCGKPACQYINVAPSTARGVCADAFIRQATLLVPDVEAYPGHIACDGQTKSEIVSPLILERGTDRLVVGVLDLDCLALGGFTEEDKLGLERIAALVVNACDW
ncbi:hypothetical protein JAAARDRAFT_37215 [Jaapia argillacea MUCL 33604]|uniref:GAF domain-containing protein n=1 Tax=Jaapia argillacea MUCL 33604 TaxID=933084 RepID=A0A067PWY1_9AGAM|nr:hypothetical protein JAAARDRAFT_37215 [Jaapia argillacea MUCL 33604]